MTAFALSGSMFALFLYHHPLHAGDRAPLAVAGRAALPAVHRRHILRGGRDRIAGGQGRASMPARSAGLAITGIGLVLMSSAKANDSWTVLLPGFIVGGLGVGLVNPVLANVALSSVPERMSGVASGINDTFRQVAIASGHGGARCAVPGALPAADRGFAAGGRRSQARGLAEAVSSGTLAHGTPAHVGARRARGFRARLLDRSCSPAARSRSSVRFWRWCSSATSTCATRKHPRASPSRWPPRTLAKQAGAMSRASRGSSAGARMRAPAAGRMRPAYRAAHAPLGGAAHVQHRTAPHAVRSA